MIGRHYNHDPHHFRFPRQMQNFDPIEDCGGNGKSLGDRLVFWGSVVIGIIALLAA